MPLALNLFMSSLNAYFKHLADLDPTHTVIVTYLPVVDAESPRRPNHCLQLTSGSMAFNMFLDADLRLLGIAPAYLEEVTPTHYVRLRGFAGVPNMGATRVIELCHHLIYLFTYTHAIKVLAYISPTNNGYTQSKLYIDLMHHLSELNAGDLKEADLDLLSRIEDMKTNTAFLRGAEFNLEPYKETDPSSYVTAEALLTDLRAGLDIDLTSIPEALSRNVLCMVQRRNKTRIMRMSHGQVLEALYEIFCEENLDEDDEDEHVPADDVA